MMKKHVLLVAALLFAAGTTSFLSCSHEHGEDTHTHADGEEHEHDDADTGGDGNDQDDDGAEDLSSTLYQCPSDCGDGEAFWEPGECSACGAEMEVIKDAT